MNHVKPIPVEWLLPMENLGETKALKAPMGEIAVRNRAA
jgi:hypothetical protein